MRRISGFVCALFIVACSSLQTSSAQQPGGMRRPKPAKSKKTPAPSGATKPTPPGGTRPGTPAAPAHPAPAEGVAPGFKEVTKGKFKEIYFRLGGGKTSGWTADYWQKFFEDGVEPGWRFMVEEPRSAKHVRMNIVTDHKALEYRLFFTTEEDEKDSSDWPGEF